MIIIQEIVTTWSKRSRGGQRAALLPPEAACLHHTVTFCEEDGFVHPRDQLTTYGQSALYRLGCIHIAPSDTPVAVTYTYDMGRGGAP